MSRELKFRAWNGTGLVYPCHPQHDTSIIFNEGSWEVFDHFTGKPQTLVLSTENPQATVMQYTGLKDRHGVEIYEGDILNVKVGQGLSETRKYKVCFNQGCFGLRDCRETERKFYGFMPFVTQNQALIENGFYDVTLKEIIEVIGSIYEHPELLKEAASSYNL